MKNRKMVILLIIGVALLAVAAVGFMSWCRRYQGGLSPISQAQLGCGALLYNHLNIFYETHQDVTFEDINSQFAQFVSSRDRIFSDIAPLSPYDSEWDFSIYLMLPKKLESAQPMLIGYTSPRLGRLGRTLYRVGFILRGKRVYTPVFDSRTLEAVSGHTPRAEPDLYFWFGKTSYLAERAKEGAK